MHAALEYNATAVSLLRKAAVCSVFCPLYQIKVLLYHMIQPTKASIAHMESCRREFVRQLYIMSKYIFLSGFQQKLGYEYDYGDYNHKWDSMRRQHRWIICLSTTVGSDDKIELKIKLKSPWECQWSSCTPQSREASPCLSNDVLLHRCSTGHQSSTGPGSEANREKNVKKKVQRGQILKCLVTLLENFQKFNTPLSVGQILFANNFESAGSGRYCPRQHYLLSAMSSWILQLRWTKQPNYAVALEIPGTTTEARSGVLLER